MEMKLKIQAEVINVKMNIEEIGFLKDTWSCRV